MASESLQVAFDEETNINFSNDDSGFKLMLKKVKPGAIFGVESTSNYHHAFCIFFLKKGYDIKEVNPIVTSQQIRCTVRKKKTDITDALLIRRILEFGEGRSMSLKNLISQFAELKKLSRSRKHLVDMRSALKRKFKSLEKDVCDTKFLQKSYKRLEKNFDKEIEKLEKKLEKYKTKNTEILKSVTGISSILSAAIEGEIGDIAQFENAKKLVAFAGLDPKIKQSGKCLNSTGKLTKRGSSHLRHALFLAARSNICSNTVFTKYYKKLIKKGKSFTQATCATARKMLEIIFVLLSKQILFDRNFCSKKVLTKA